MLNARPALLLLAGLAFAAPTGARAAEPATAQAAEPRPAPLAEMGLAKLDLTVAPYGDVTIDGRLRAKNATQASVWLPPGVYEVEVKNPWARPSRRRVEVPASGASAVIRLQPRPARLVVVTNVDAAVQVDDRPVGRSWTSELLPLSVPVDGWRARREAVIEIRRQGFRPVKIRAQLEAGTTRRLEATLRPEEGAKRASRSVRVKPLIADALGLGL